VAMQFPTGEVLGALRDAIVDQWMKRWCHVVF
jgi:hypothetical protein